MNDDDGNSTLLWDVSWRSGIGSYSVAFNRDKISSKFFFLKKIIPEVQSMRDLLPPLWIKALKVYFSRKWYVAEEK